MINIRQDDSVNLNTKQALFVSFKYNLGYVKRIKKLPVRYYIPKTKEWEIPIRNIDDVISLFSDTKMNILGNVRKNIEEKIDNMVHFEIPKTDYKFKTKPFQHQMECFEYAKKHNKFLLADEMGLGKTKQSIDIAAYHSKQFKHCLIICCVNGVKWSWLDEVNKHSNLKGHILGIYRNKKGKLKVGTSKDRLKDLLRDIPEYFLITNIETLRYSIKEKDKKGRIIKRYPIDEKLSEMCKSGEIGITIIDEAHKIKDPSSISNKSVQKLNSYYKIALTGTPIMNSPLDSFNILKWLDVEKHPFTAFKKHYCTFGGYGGYEVISFKHMQELQNLIASSMLRRKKEDVLDLPEKIYIKEYVELTNQQQKLYDDVRNSILDDLDKIKIMPNPLAQLIRLRQVTASTAIVSDKINESAKIGRLKEMLKELENKKVIIYTNWTSVTDIVQKELREYNPLIITGKTKDEDSKDIVHEFQTNPHKSIILGTIGAMGTGITLNVAENVIFLDEPWNMALKTQCIDRAHRIGTKHNVTITTLISKNTIDERVNELVESKGIIADALIDNNLTKLNKSKLVDFLIN